MCRIHRRVGIDVVVMDRRDGRRQSGARRTGREQGAGQEAGLAALDPAGLPDPRGVGRNLLRGIGSHSNIHV